MEDTRIFLSREKSQNAQPCPICKKRSNQVLAHKLRRGKGTVYFCEDCCVGFLISKKIDLNKFYASEYRKKVSHRSNRSETNPKELFEFYGQFQQKRLEIIKPYLSKGKNILEIGASSGMFLKHIKEDCSRVCAIELDLECANFLKKKLGIETDNKVLELSRFSKEKFDIICSFQVLEHTDNPVFFLEKIRECLKPGGVAFIEVPNLFDPLLVQWKVPAYKSFYYHSEHIFYFSHKSMKKIAKMAGFNEDEIEINFTQDYNLLNHLNWILNDTPQDTSEIGLSDIELKGNDEEIATWLSNKMEELNKEYCNLLEKKEMTSNMMIVLKN